MHKGEYLTGDFQTFTVYENGKVVAKRKTRKEVNIVIKLWKGYLNNNQGAYSYMFTFSKILKQKRKIKKKCTKNGTILNQDYVPYLMKIILLN